ncbi:LPS assembly lipoprotein LptE [Rhodovulum tesquicola]|uniref:LPS assembly lipoprotein LptE n=1 Tax=Rhodovulum tesquicola TaxID=540254 RepID=UPI002096F6DB|nr:LPS assembly lipoprotein LptE [Rhodovulum tesquicola]MCO8144826.1 LPS assembly lipoprotein LptE [Rhodovulum tesquicola]
MSSSDRRTLVLGLAALALGGCGFRPAHGPEGVASDLRGGIAIDPPDTRNAFALVERLEDRLGRADAPVYRLGHRIGTSRRALGITGAQETTRFTIEGDLAFELYELATGRLVQSGKVTAFSAYSATGSTVATLAAERDAERRLMVMLADQLVTRLIATAPGRAR